MAATWASRLKRLEGDKQKWNLVYRCNWECFFLSPHYFTTEAKKTKPTFGSDAKMHQMDAVSSRQHMPGLQQRVYFVSTPTPPPSSSLPQRCWFPFCCICIFTHTHKYKHTHTYTCTDRNPVAKLGSCNYFTNDWALSGVTRSEKCVHVCVCVSVTAKERYSIELMKTQNHAVCQ